MRKQPKSAWARLKHTTKRELKRIKRREELHSIDEAIQFLIDKDEIQATKK